MFDSRNQSESDPFREPELARRMTLAAVRAAAMGLAPPGDVAAASPDAQALETMLARVQRAGIGRGLVREKSASYDPDQVLSLLDDLYEALARSPVPETEWPALGRVFHHERLAGLLRISESSLKRYATGDRRTPDDVAARLHFIALVVGDLAGSYNEIGIRRWFERKRPQLDGRAPAELLDGAWDPDDPGPSRVRALAAALLGAPVT